MNQDVLRQRVKHFMETLTLPISRFAGLIGFERSSYYRWIKGEFDFCEKRALQIDEFLKQFGF